MQNLFSCIETNFSSAFLSCVHRLHCAHAVFLHAKELSANAEINYLYHRLILLDNVIPFSARSASYIPDVDAFSSSTLEFVNLHFVSTFVAEKFLYT